MKILTATLLGAALLSRAALAQAPDTETLRAYVNTLHAQRDQAASQKADLEAELANNQRQMSGWLRYFSDWCGDSPGCATPAPTETPK